MKLQQLRFVCEVVRQGLNVSAAADVLFTSQPGISKQIRLLEEELGVQIFGRTGKQFTHVTEPGKAIVAMAEHMLQEVKNIRQVALEARDDSCGNLSIATTHTQARHALPEVVVEFRRRYPKVVLHMHQGTPMQIAELASTGAVDFAIATEAMEHFENLVMMPCYHWNRCVIVPVGHPLLQESPLTLERIAAYPIVTYVFGFTGRSKLDQAFEAHHLRPDVVFTAADSEVIKTYVRLGLGIGIIAKMAYQPEADRDLRAIDASHLFEYSTTNIGFRRGTFLRGYMYDFVHLFAPHLTRDAVDAYIGAESDEARTELINSWEPSLAHR